MTSVIAEIPAILSASAVIAFAAGGLLLILRARKLGGLVLMAGIGLGAGAALSPQFMQGGDGTALVGLFSLLSGIAGVVALMANRPGVGLSLLWPPLSRWLIWPQIMPYLPQAPIWLIALVVAPFSVFIGIWLLQKILTPIYGASAASHVTGEYLVRALDGTGRLLVWIVTAPFRLLKRRGSGAQ